MSFETPRGPVLDRIRSGVGPPASAASASPSPSASPSASLSAIPASPSPSQPSVSAAVNRVVGARPSGGKGRGNGSGSSSSSSSSDETEGGGPNATSLTSQNHWESVTSVSTKLVMFERVWQRTLKFVRRLRSMGNAYVNQCVRTRVCHAQVCSCCQVT